MRFKKLFFLFVFSTALIYGCRKELYNLDSNTTKIPLTVVDSLKQQFYDKKYDQNLLMKLNDTTSIKWTIDWTNYSKSNLGDTLSYFYFPLTALRYNDQTKTTDSPILEINLKKFLLIGKRKNGNFFRLATYIFNSDRKKINSLGKNYKFKNFSGQVEYKNFDIKTTDMSFYKNGIKVQDPNKVKGNLTVNSIQKTDDAGVDCYNQLTCYYAGFCNGTDYYVTVVVGRDYCPGAPTFSPSDCIGIFSGWGYVRTDVDYICNPVYTEPPIVTPVVPPTDGSGTVTDISHVDDPTKKPCPGDPVKLSVLAPSNPNNINGGKYGPTRTQQIEGQPGLQAKNHYGIDIAARPNTPLYPIMDGTVVDLRTSFTPGQYAKGSFGNYVVIRTTLPSGDILEVKYAHLNALKSTIVIGSSVSQGVSMGLTGRTGNPAHTSDVLFPHVHIETRLNGQHVNPEPYLRTKFDSSGAAIVTPC